MLTFSDSLLSFLQKSTSRIAKVLYHAYEQEFPAYRLMITTNAINYLTFRKDGTLSYLPAGRAHELTPTGRWSSKGRVSGKPGKVIRKLFTEKALQRFSDADFESFCNQYKSCLCNGLQFYVQPSRFISDIYNRRIAQGSGSLNLSCMNGRGNFLNIYENCRNLRILVLINSLGDICGRALIWKAGKETFLDRIYVTQDFMYDCFINYANKKGWLHKANYKTYEDKTRFVLPSGQEVVRFLKIKTKTDFECYPYIDTFSYGDDGSLNNFGEGDYTYNCSLGERKCICDEDADVE